MEREVRYCTTEDGVNIAYTVAGNGPPLLQAASPPFSPLLGWELFGPTLFQPLADTFQLIQIDTRGTGHSDRDALDFSVAAIKRDLRAVVAAVGQERYALLAFVDAVPSVLEFASENPDAVTHLIVCDGWTKWTDFTQSPTAQVEEAIRDKDWVLYTETFAQVLWDFNDHEMAREIAAWMRASCTPEAMRACYAALNSWDVTDCLSRIQAPTLVLHNKRNTWQKLGGAQRIAAGVPDARLLVIDDMLWLTVAELVMISSAEGP